jgi:glycosyltransferase involved in cell wall biosynthesis
LPSVEEGSALVTYEAQASGCALLVSRQAGAVIDDGQQGLVHEAGDVGALERHLRQLDTDRDLVARLRRGALANSKRLTWDHAGVDLVAGYRAGVVSMPGGGIGRTA